MTTKLAIEIPRLELTEIQRRAAESYAGLLLATRHFIRSRWGVDALRDFEEVMARDHAQCLKGRGITSPLDFVKNLAIQSVNVHGSDIEIEGDDSYATFDCKSCGVCSVIKDMEAAHKVEGKPPVAVKDISPLRYFELLSKEMGFDFKGEIRGDGLYFSVSRPVGSTEEYLNVD